MKRQHAVMAVAVILVILTVVTATVPALGQTSKVVVTELYAAPYGFIYTNVSGDWVGAYVADDYVTFRAVSRSGTIIFPSDGLTGLIGKSVSEDLTVELRVIDRRPDVPGIVVRPFADNIYVMTFRNGNIYASWRPVIYNYVEPGSIAIIVPQIQPTIPINNTGPDTTIIIAAQTPSQRLFLDYGTHTIATTVGELVGASGTCFATYPPDSSLYKWGLVLAPPCTSHVEVLETDEGLGYPVAVTFRLALGDADIIITSREPAPDWLASLGLIRLLSAVPYYHSLAYQTEAPHIYVDVGGTLQRAEEIAATWATQVVDGRHVCTVPVGAEIVAQVAWRTFKPGETYDLIPGEIVLYRSGYGYYLCAGDFSYLTAEIVEVLPIREFRQPYKVLGSPMTVVALAGGDVYWGRVVEVPYDDYVNNYIYILGARPYYRTGETESMIFSPTTVFIALSAAMAVIAWRMRPRTPKTTLKVVWDLHVPAPPALATGPELQRRLKQFVNAHGVCPTDEDLALRKVLVPIPPGDPDKPDILCPWRTNTRAEKRLRELWETLIAGFWAIRRIDKRTGYVYTEISDWMPLFYLYRQEDESEPTELFFNALKAVRKVKISKPHMIEKHGLMIVAEPELARRLERLLVGEGVIDPETGAAGENALAAFITRHVDAPNNSEKEKLVSMYRSIVTDAGIRRILVVGFGPESLRRVVSVLGDITADKFEYVLRIQGLLDED